MKLDQMSKEQLIKEIKKVKAEKEKLSSEKFLFDTFMEHTQDSVYFKDKESRFIRISRAGAKGMGFDDPGELVGKTDFDIFTDEHAKPAFDAEKKIMETGKPIVGIQEKETWLDGRETWVSTTKVPLKDKKGTTIGTFGVSRDITEHKRAEQVLRRQSKEIIELSTPVIKVWDRVVAAPLIGTLDSQRTQYFMERLLNAIVETNSPVALVDITGVPTIDTKTAQYLIETISAVKLLGAQVILTGVRPAIAQSLVHLGTNLSEITTCTSLAAGLRVALNLLDLKVVSK